MVVKDLLPAGLTLVLATPEQGTYDPATGNWTVGSIPKGVTYELLLTARANPGTSGTTLTNRAALIAIDQRESDPTNNQADLAVTVNTTDLRLIKTVNEDTPDEGSTIQYTIKVKNLGPSALASGVTVQRCAARRGHLCDVQRPVRQLQPDHGRVDPGQPDLGQPGSGPDH